MNLSGTQQDSVDHILSARPLRSGLAALVGLSALLLAGPSAAQTAGEPAGQTPARATIEAKLANPAYRIEVLVVAAA